ncbi:MAG: fumarylacetoacetate hydrolase family protein [Nocardioidaceae bacterium]
MRWVRYRPSHQTGAEQLGVLVGDEVRGAGPGDLLDLIGSSGLERAGLRALASPTEVRPLEDVVLLAPVERPPSIRDFMSFEQHVEGMGRLVGARPHVPDVWYQQPLFYFSNPASVIGPGDDVPIPPGCDVFDFELEVAAVVGPVSGIDDLADLTLDESARAVAGYLLMNDWSARDLQSVEMQGPLGPCKGKDSSTTLGPWFLTADELPDLASGGPTGVNLSVTVNDVLFGESSVDSMGWSFAEMVAYASRGTRLRTGDVLGSGTCGDGCLAERWGRRGRDSVAPLRPDDVVTLSGGPLGSTANRVVTGSPIRQALDRRPVSGAHR